MTRSLRVPTAARGLLALLLLGSTSGCVNIAVGHTFDPARAREIEPLRTTRSEVHALLGPPLRAERVGTVRIEVHKSIVPNRLQLVLVSYRDGDEVVHVTAAD